MILKGLVFLPDNLQGGMQDGVHSALISLNIATFIIDSY